MIGETVHSGNDRNTSPSVLADISARPFIWGSFIWNLFDFGASHRREGDRDGKNDKGLVTYNRKAKKDAWWFYKASWVQDEPVLYIAGPPAGRWAAGSGRMYLVVLWREMTLIN